ncbi:VOC family protein [Solicola sp. PLA-1-18]|uniref:VOC family protein n=1 Tax=Solicola sp. PLA-1-18 TaxID=3380532 RepID=UPI003B7C8AA8
MTGAGDQQPRTYPPGVTCWIDTEQPDVDAALAFYGGLLGWSFTEAMPPGAPGRYVVATLGGQDVAGIGGPADGEPSWSTYVAVADADEAAAHLTGLGATVVSPPEDAGPGGRAAVLRDPEGAEFRLWQARRRLGAQAANVPGAWNFSNLHTADPAAAQAFYGAAFGWAFADQGWATSVQVPGYGDHLESTVDPDIRTRQAQAPEGFEDTIGAIVPVEDEAPHWHVVVTVQDRDASAALAESLGATVLRSADEEWSRTATVRDPQGAVLTLSQFAPPTDWG